MGASRTALVSMIVPAFNAERYLEKCLSSILGQTHRGVEVILVDDGSTDATAQIAERLSFSDARLKCVSLEENAGVHRARVAGIARACGDYIGFVDADDWLRVDMVGAMLSRLEEDGSDIAICGVAFPDNEGREVRRRFRFRHARTLDNALENFTRLRFGSGYLGNKLYRRHVVLECAMQEFSERLDLGEDTIVNVGAFHNARLVSLVPEALYFYRQHGKSAAQGVPRSAAFAHLLRAYYVCLKTYSDLGEDVLARIDALYMELFSFECYSVSKFEDLAAYREDVEESVSGIASLRPESAASFIRENRILFERSKAPAVRRWIHIAKRGLRQLHRKLLLAT